MRELFLHCFFNLTFIIWSIVFRLILTIKICYIQNNTKR